jgi:hypothetical protein
MAVWPSGLGAGLQTLSPQFDSGYCLVTTEYPIQPGLILAWTQYGPATETTYNANTSTLTIMDGTNLTLTVEVPPSGDFYVDVTADWAFGSNGSLNTATDIFLGLVKHADTSTVYQIQSWCGTNQPNFVNGARSTHRYLVTGQTAGSSLQFDLAMGVSSTTDLAFAAFYAQANGGALTTNPVEPILIQAFAS